MEQTICQHDKVCIQPEMWSAHRDAQVLGQTTGLFHHARLDPRLEVHHSPAFFHRQGKAPFTVGGIPPLAYRKEIKPEYPAVARVRSTSCKL